jgi:hypothetical protein
MTPIQDLDGCIEFTIKDSSNMGSLLRDECIGVCSLPMSRLTDQRKRTVILDVSPPPNIKKWSARAARCTLKVEVHLLYSKIRYWGDRILLAEKALREKEAEKLLAVERDMLLAELQAEHTKSPANLHTAVNTETNVEKYEDEYAHMDDENRAMGSSEQSDDHLHGELTDPDYGDDDDDGDGDGGGNHDDDDGGGDGGNYHCDNDAKCDIEYVDSDQNIDTANKYRASGDVGMRESGVTADAQLKPSLHTYTRADNLPKPRTNYGSAYRSLVSTPTDEAAIGSGTYSCMYAYVHVCVRAWMDGWMDGWVDGWMD